MNGGEITASGETKENGQSGLAAGIGGGFGSKGLGGTILITCGTIRAKGGEAAAGIGSGNAADGTCNIHIQGGIIYASTNIADGQNESFFERFYAIGSGSGWTDGSITITNGVVITKGQINKSNKDTWRGLIFENTETDGIVYGDPTLSQKFTLEDTQNLLIPENTSLQGTANLTNDGNIYVSGTLAESVSGSQERLAHLQAAEGHHPVGIPRTGRPEKALAPSRKQVSRPFRSAQRSKFRHIGRFLRRIYYLRGKLTFKPNLCP